jgi:hypothetical protein
MNIDPYENDDEIKDPLVCTRCGAKKEMYCHIVYSQGSRVCLDCKQITLESDKRAFDNYIFSR